jgi:magnesium transporter
VHAILYFDRNGKQQNHLTFEDIPQALEDQQGLLWLDFEGEPPELCEPVLIETFCFHPLAVDDALQETHIPKIDDWEQYLYIALRAISFQVKDGDMIETPELDVFLGHNYIVTHHDKPVLALERTWKHVQRDNRHIKQGADHILYLIIDELTVEFMKVVEQLDDEIEIIEDLIFDLPGPEILEKAFTLKRATIHLRRTLSPLREVLNKLARDQYDVIDTKDRIYFRDVYDHLVRLYDITETLRELVNGALETYLSVINNRMNDTVKTLTVITTMFMPISFVAGFFGMNFFEPVLSTSAWMGGSALVLTLLLMVAAPSLMYLYIRKRGWM